MKKELMMMWKIQCVDMFDVPLLLSEVEASKEREKEGEAFNFLWYQRASQTPYSLLVCLTQNYTGM